MILRDYQEAAVCSIFEYFASGKTGNPIVAMPTGTGKSIVLGEFIKRALQTYPGTRVMKLTHVKELVSQNLDKLLQLWPEAPAGVYSAGLKRKEQGCPITFGGVASVAKASPSIFGRIDLLLIDECHLVSQKETTMYRVIIDVLESMNPSLKVIGFTATHYRLGHGMLTESGGIFTDVCFDLTRMDAFNWFIDQGYLATLIPRTTAAEFDLSEVHIHGGEYKQDELQAAVDKSEITYAACQELRQWGHDREHWLLFASGIEHAEHVASCLQSMGVAATFVHSKLPNEVRDSRIADFVAGKYRAMINNGILTTGFDFPGIDLIGMLRATLSPGLWCLSNDTEVLTPEGFKGCDEIKIGDAICGYNEKTGQISATVATGYIKRPLSEGERLLSYGSRNHAFCMTDSHRFLYEQRIGKGQWEVRKRALGELTSSTNRRMITAGFSRTGGVDKSGELLVLIGLYLTDGTFDKSNQTLVIYQSERYPAVCEEIERVAAALNLEVRIYRLKHSEEQGAFESDYFIRRYVISKTTRQPGMLGWSSCLSAADFEKDFPDSLMLCNESELGHLLHGINLGDGAKYACPSIDWTPSTFSISTGRKRFADRLQLVCIQNGYSCAIAEKTNRNGKPLYLLYICKKVAMTFKPEFLTEENGTGQNVWCVENPTGNLITRYKGRVTITGNCQMLGRGTRPVYASGFDLSTLEGRHDAIKNGPKQNCLVLDFAGNTRRLGPINDPVLPRKKGKSKGQAPVKVCEVCGTYNHASVRFCAGCAAEFPRHLKISEQAGTDELIATQEIKTAIFKVDRVTYSKHHKQDFPDSIQVSYYCGLRMFKEWVCLEHDGFASKKARDWWRERSVGYQPPDTTAEAMDLLDSLKEPTHIRVWLKTKYDDILGYDFTGNGFGETE